MKRRRFLKNIGLGSSGVVVTDKLLAEDAISSNYSYGQITSLGQAMTKEGLINIRLEFRSKIPGTISAGKGKITVSKGKINRMKEYFFEEGEDLLDGGDYDISISNKQSDIVAVWIEDAKPKTIVRINDKKGKVSFTLEELVKNHEISLPRQQEGGGTGQARMEVERPQITANFLLDKEIAEIEPEDFGAKDPGDEFKFVVMADPQGGDPEEEGNHPTRMKIHNAWVEESIKQANLMNPATTLILGDIVDGQGQARNFIQMARYFEKLESPMLYAIGNHETKYKSVFTPGYNMEAFNNYFDAQQKMNGLELILYSFNLGSWHFIIWPDPLRENFWETHPHYFDWLERDLEKYKNRPTVFFQHVPSHPIGINPLINYAESVDVKRLLLKILSKHENVKYNFSGHVHIPIKASFKTAVTFKGIDMINLPPAGYRPRAFGEQDFNGGPCQGILVLEFNGIESRAIFRTVTEEEYIYPKQLPKFDNEKYKLWLNHKWELSASSRIENGNFKNSLSGWTKRYVYTEDAYPSNICETRNEKGKNALYLYSRKRGFDMPGQDRLPQTINRICQAIQLKSDCKPVIGFNYKIDEKSDLSGWCGAYVWIEGFNGSFKMLNLVYSTGIAFSGIGGKFNRSEFNKNIHLGLSDEPGKWHNVSLNLARDHEANHEKSYNNLALDKLVINLGVWTINDGGDFPYEIYFTDFNLNYKQNSASSSTVNGLNIIQKPDDKIWWLGKYLPFTHVAGEHRYILGTKKMGPKG